MSVIICCKDCADRYSGCHQNCEKYKAEKEAHDLYKEREHKESDIRWGLREQRTRAVMAAYKRSGNRKKPYYYP